MGHGGASKKDRPSFRSYLAETRPQIEERVLQLLTRCAKAELDKNLLPLMLGGKRLRGGLTMLVFDAFSEGKGNRAVALDLAAAVELAHASSLVLDDIIDEDEKRRGLAAVHILEGEKRALLMMVGAISIPYTIASLRGDTFVAPLAEVQRRMVQGALEEMSGSPSPTFADYMRIITLKTGELFGLSAYYGAVVAGCAPVLASKLSRFGLETGKVMQMADDIADLRKALDGTGRFSRGSEMVLLRTIIPDRLASELETDLRAGRLTSVAVRLGEVMGRDWLDHQLKRHLATELQKMAITIGEIQSDDSTCSSPSNPVPEVRTLLRTVPNEIALLIFEDLDAETGRSSTLC